MRSARLTFVLLESVRGRLMKTTMQDHRQYQTHHYGALNVTYATHTATPSRILLKIYMSECTMSLRTRRGSNEGLKVIEIGREHLALSAGSF